MTLELSQTEVNEIIREYCQRTMNVTLVDILSYQPFRADIAPIVKTPLDEDDI